MNQTAALPVVLLPGSVLPAELAYGALLAALGPGVDALTKELAVYDHAEPPADYRLDDEIDSLARAADRRGFERFHLVGYSAGGAGSLAFTARHPQRVLSLTLLEPAWAGYDDLSPEEQALRERFAQIMQLPPPQRMEAFTRVQLRPGVAPAAPPPGPPPPWMAKRPAGIAALVRAFDHHDLDLEALRRFTRPVRYVLGGLSNPDLYERQAERLSRVFPDFTLEVYEQRHHFDPPHRIEPERLAASLREHWERAACDDA
jgi:pimeloyl-ACP methyl ester carboxylesterase